MKRTVSVLLSVLFCPLSFLGVCALWLAGQRFFRGELVFLTFTFDFGFQWAALTFALGTLLYYLWAGGALSRWSGLTKGAILLWMLLAGYPLCWAAAILCLPALLRNGFILFPLLIVTLALAAVWGLWGLARLLLRFFRTPPREYLRRGKNALSTAWGIAKPLLLTAAVAGLLLSVQGLVTLRPAADYADQGVHTFVASSAYPTSRKTTVRGQTRTRTVYLLTYKAPGTGYTYTQELPAESTAKQAVREKRRVERRVLSIPAERKYITVDPKYPDAESYVSACRQRYLLILTASAAVFAAAAVVLIWRKRRHEPDIETAQLR